MQNPPTYTSVTIRYGQLQTLGSGGLATDGAAGAAVFEYDSKLPVVVAVERRVQMMLPWATALDVEYVGQHGYNISQDVNLNAVDFGAAFLAQNQDALAGCQPRRLARRAVLQDQMRAFRGYGAITQQWGRGWRTYHSLQLSFNRRFQNGFSFGFNDTILLSSEGSTAARLQHNPDGSYSLRSDQAEADALLGRTIDRRHIMKANFVWDLPDLRAGGPTMRALSLIVNDWQLSGIWTGQTGTNYTVGFSYQNGGWQSRT